MTFENGLRLLQFDGHIHYKKSGQLMTLMAEPGR
jgi:hypothetical protein